MGINNQPYLGPFFAQLRASFVARGQKVEPINPVAKTAGYERSYCPAVVLNLRQEHPEEVADAPTYTKPPKPVYPDQDAS